MTHADLVAVLRIGNAAAFREALIKHFEPHYALIA